MYYKLYFSTKFAFCQQDLQKERVTPYNSRPVCPYNIGNSYLIFTARTRMFLIYNNIDVDIPVESEFYFNCLSSLKKNSTFYSFNGKTFKPHFTTRNYRFLPHFSITKFQHVIFWLRIFIFVKILTLIWLLQFYFKEPIVFYHYKISNKRTLYTFFSEICFLPTWLLKTFYGPGI